MRKFNKVTALLLAATMAAMTMGGCGSEKSAGDSGKQHRGDKNGGCERTD